MAQTNAKIVASANELARQFYLVRGYEVPAGYRFDKATHPHEREAWRMVAIAFEFLRGTEIDEVIAELEEEAPF